MTTAKEQFINDYTLVIDNDYDMYQGMKDIVIDNEFSAVAIGDVLYDQYNQAINEALETSDVSESLKDLMRQLLLGWGSSVFDDIALYYIETFKADNK